MSTSDCETVEAPCTGKETAEALKQCSTNAGGRTNLHAVEAGDWVPVDVLHASILPALEANTTFALNAEGVDHITGSTLQLLLALNARKGQDEQPALELSGVSADLARWFGYAGASFLIAAHPEAE